MRQIGTLPDQDAATTFEDHLLTLDIKSIVEQANDGWSVWVFDEDHVDQAKAELNEFAVAPDDARYHQSRKAAGSIRKEEEKRNERLKKLVVDVRGRWHRPIYAQVPVTISLMVISVLVSVASEFGARPEPVVTALGFSDIGWEAGDLFSGKTGIERIAEGQIWRLITPAFLHFSWMHLFGNMYLAFFLGGMIEARRGAWRFLGMVLLFAAVSNFAQFVAHGPDFGGMSGVDYGLFGYAWMKSRFDPNSGIYVSPNLVFLLIAWFFLCWTGGMGSVANTAHLTGLILGMSTGYAPKLWRDMSRG